MIFDFGQTLVDSADGFRAAEKSAKEQIFSNLFPDGNDDQWQAFLVEYRHIRKKFHANSKFSRPAIWQAVYDWANAQADPVQLAQMETAYWDLVKSRTVPFPETITVLEQLAGRFQLGVITNTQGMKTSGSHRIALYPEIERFFETIIVAGESGVPAKPDPKPFLLCMERMGLEPAEAIYVGDDFQKDVCGAGDAGLYPVWIKHCLVKRTWPKPGIYTEAPVITDLTELVAIGIMSD